MNYLRKILYILVIFVCFWDCSPNNSHENLIEESSISIAYWNHGAKSALSFIWDDSYISHFVVIAPIFNAIGYSTTFAAITSHMEKNYIDEYKELVRYGHEVCSHSHRHIRMTTLNEEEMKYELEKSKESIIENLGVIPTTFIHPNNGTNDVVNDLVSDYYLFTRIYDDEDYPLKWVWNMSTGSTYVKMIRNLENGIEKGRWMVYAGHAVDGDGWEPIRSDDLANFLSFLKSSPEENVWVDTFSKIALYNEVREHISGLTVVSNYIKIDDSNIDYSIYEKFGVKDLPICIKIESPIDQYNFEGDNIDRLEYRDGNYYVSINMLSSNKIYYKRK